MAMGTAQPRVYERKSGADWMLSKVARTSAALEAGAAIIPHDYQYPYIYLVPPPLT